MDLKQIVTETAQAAGQLSDDGAELSVTSMTVIELVMQLEEATGIEIPNTEMLADNFKSIDSVVQMLERLRSK